MIYTEPLIYQLSRFLGSIGFGFGICLLYMAVKLIFRIFGKGRLTVYLSDGIFWLIASVVVFLYMVLINNGSVRLNLMLSVLGGAFGAYMCLGKYIMRLLYRLSDLLNLLLRLLLLPVKYLLRNVRRLLKKLFRVRKHKNKKKKSEESRKKIKILHKSS